MRNQVVRAAFWLVASAATADQTINIGPDIAFHPPTLTVAPGETVTWVWMGSPHSSTSNATSGPEFWDAGIRSVGASFSHTFNTPGSYPFYCKVHSSPTGTRMNGVIQVAAPTLTPTAAAPTVTPSVTSSATPAPLTPTPIPPTAIPSATAPGPTPIPGNGAAAIPMLGTAASSLLALALLGIAWALFHDRRR